jgi:hypothetical protein
LQPAKSKEPPSPIAKTIDANFFISLFLLSFLVIV